MITHNVGTIIEGVGDDLMFGLMLSTIVVVPLLTYFIYWYQSQRDVSIHPQSASVVEDTRNRLRTAQQNAQNADSSNPSNGHDAAASRPATTSSSPANTQSIRRDRTCPICLAEITFGIETNCGHLFCGECIVTYWRHGNWLGAVRCPVCRQQVTLLLQNFTDADHNSAEPNRHDIMQQINRYNRRFSGQPVAWLDYLRDLPTLLRHAIREVFTLSGLVWMFRLRIVICFIAALLYFISPLDLIPEAAFGILGLLDDFFVLLLLGIYVTIIYRRAVAARATGEPY